MHICDYGGGWDWRFYQSYLHINSRAIYIRAILLHGNIQGTNSYSLACKGINMITKNL